MTRIIPNGRELVQALVQALGWGTAISAGVLFWIRGRKFWLPGLNWLLLRSVAFFEFCYVFCVFDPFLAESTFSANHTRNHNHGFFRCHAPRFERYAIMVKRWAKPELRVNCTRYANDIRRLTLGAGARIFHPLPFALLNLFSPNRPEHCPGRLFNQELALPIQAEK